MRRSLEEAHDESSQLHAVAAQLGTASYLGHQALQDPRGRTCRKWGGGRGGDTPALNKAKHSEPVPKPSINHRPGCITAGGRCHHHAPGMVLPLADDQVQLVVPQAVLQNSLHSRTQVFQDQADDGGTAGAAAQTQLRAESTRGRGGGRWGVVTVSSEK